MICQFWLRTEVMKVILKYFNLFSLLLLIYLSGCNNVKDNSSESNSIKDFSEWTIDYQFNAKELIKYSDFCDSVIYLPLYGIGEFNGSFDNLKIHNNLIYATERGTGNCVFVFSMKGMLVNKIGAKGRGPGEFNTVTDFVINDRTKTIDIYDNAKRAILSFDIENGNFKKSIDIGLIGRAIELLGSGKYVIYSDDINIIHSEKINPGILLLSKNGDFEKNIYEFDAEMIRQTIAPLNYFSTCKPNEIWFCDLINGSLNKLHGEVVTEKIEIKTIHSPVKNQDENNQGIISFVVSGDYLICLIKTSESGHCILVNISDKSVQSGLFLVDNLSGLLNGPYFLTGDGTSGIIFKQDVYFPEAYQSWRKDMKNFNGGIIEENPKYKDIEKIRAEDVTALLKIAVIKK